MSGTRLIPSRAYSFGELVQISGATTSNVTHWAREGVIIPTVKQTSGTGHHRAFGFRNLVEARLAVRMNKAGMPVHEMGGFLEHIRFLDDASNAVAARRNDTLELLLKKASRQRARQMLGTSLDELYKNGRGFQFLKTPELRTEQFRYFGIAFSLLDFIPTLVIIEADDEIHLPALGEASLLVDLGQLISAIETATGDRWPGGVSPDEVREILRERLSN